MGGERSVEGNQAVTGREERIATRRSQILDGAAAVFAEKGFHRATTREIAQAAGVSEGTIYNYFDSKEDLLIGIMSRLIELEQLGGELSEALRGDAREFFVTMFDLRMEQIQAGQQMLQALLPEIMVNSGLGERFHERYITRISRLMEQYVAARIERDEMRQVDIPLAVRTMQAIFIGLLVLRILGDETLRTRWDDLPQALATVIFDGLSPHKEA
jgi:AcrR family transcriptional regulator